MNEKPDKSKTYSCYFCEEPVVCTLSSEKQRLVLVDKGINLTPKWRHLKTGNVSCETSAAPSNLEVLPRS